MLLNKAQLKGLLQNISIELIGELIMIGIAFVMGYYIKIFFLM